MTFRTLIIAIATLSASAPATAETINGVDDITPDSSFAAFLASDFNTQALARVAGFEDLALGRLCEEAYVVDQTGINVIDPIEFSPGARLPDAGRWITRFAATRCGSTVTYNAVFEVKDGQVGFFAGPPGTTNIDLELARDLTPVILEQAAVPACDTKTLYDTNPGVPVGYQAEDRTGIYETWTVFGCGDLIDLVLRFRQSDDGSVDVDVEHQQAP